MSGNMMLEWQDDGERTPWVSVHVVAECHEARGFPSCPMLCLDVSPRSLMVTSDASGAQTRAYPGPDRLASGGQHTGREGVTDHSRVYISALVMQ